MAPSSSNGKPKKSDTSLSQQYGGIHTGGWVDMFPSSWVPFIQLSRLSPPAALFIIYLPHLFGVAHAAITENPAGSEVLRICALLFCGSFFCSNASHAWNDLVDAPIDKLIPRTRSRPIPRGAITRRAAFVFAAVQALGAASFLLFLPVATAKAVVPNIVGTIYYPYAKRHTHFAQVILGFCLTWGIIVGSSAMGAPKPWADKSTLSLLFASVLWVIIFDTIYAHQDVSDDIKVGVKSMAVMFNKRAKPLLWVLFTCMSCLLVSSGYYGGTGPCYYTLSVGGSIASVGLMIFNVDLEDPASCWKWFSSGFWVTGVPLLLVCSLNMSWVEVFIHGKGL
ncbi:UbiA prenyltransferase family-domain-containing protein [Bisporella sp. PMI_857]|nr:UbiA prenyltransferase family-domain-containing protein [Bisporella sp. PMI_857]